MIQRIQSIYLLIAIALLLFGTFTSSWFALANSAQDAIFNAGGIDIFTKGSDQMIEHKAVPFFIGTLILILLSLATMLSYKNIKLQMKLGRLNFVVYLLFILGLTIWSFTGESMLNGEFPDRSFSFGYYSIVCGFPFTYLANIGIKRDKALLDSLNRIR